MDQSTAIVRVSPNTRKSLSNQRFTRLALVRTPSGTIIGEIILEGDRRVFVRRVIERVRFRLHDAWPLGAFALQQLVHWRVAVIRYLAPDGIYQTTLEDFLARAIPLEFPMHDEVQYVLPRTWWPVRPTLTQRGAVQEQLALTSPGEVGA